VRAWRLPTEPWAFVIGTDGRIATRLEGDRACAEFEQAMVYLGAAPLSSREITESLAASGRAWEAMTQALANVRSAAGQQALLDASEALLASFEQLTERYERSMQMLMG